MDYLQIAHDLAIAKLHGSQLSANEIVTKYYKYLEEYKSALSSKPVEATVVEVIDRRKLGI